MTNVQYTDLQKITDVNFLPTGFWSGFFVFGSLWLLPVLTLIALANA